MSAFTDSLHRIGQRSVYDSVCYDSQAQAQQDWCAEATQRARNVFGYDEIQPIKTKPEPRRTPEQDKERLQVRLSVALVRIKRRAK